MAQTKEVINGQIDHTVKILKSMVKSFKDFNISTEEYNDILFKKIAQLEKEKIS